MHVTIEYTPKIKHQTKPKDDPLLDCVEIAVKDLKYLQGCWVKYHKTESRKQICSGIVSVLEPGCVKLRQIKSKDLVIVTTPDEYLWYCKTNLENYKAVVEINNAMQRLGKY